MELKETIIGISIGITIIWWTYKKYPSGNSMVLTDAKGYIGGIFAILLGILFIVGKLKWQ